jgi:putative spermidine/putrescine transport system permease protein
MAGSASALVADIGPGLGRARLRWRPTKVGVLLIAPALLWIAVFFLAPLGLMCWRAVAQTGWASYGSLLSSPQYLKVFLTTVQICLISTIGCLVLGYPIAYAATVGGARTRAALLMLVILPYWLDYIVRSYSWMILLGRRGLANDLLIWLGIADAPLPLLYNLFSVCVGMIQILLPMMILTLFAGMVRIDLRLLDAATIHGASHWSAFRTVFLPLSLPGVYAASLLVFVTSLGFYITPALLGGPQQTMISQSIMVLAADLLDWPMASAAGVVLLLVTMALVVVYNRFFSIDRLWGGALQ